LGDLDEGLEQALKVLDAELSATVARLQRIRQELDLILRQDVPVDLPAPVAKAVADADAGLTSTARMLEVVLAQVVSPVALNAFAGTLREYAQDPAVAEFDALPADADSRSRQDLADRLRASPIIQRQRADHIPGDLVIVAGCGPDHDSAAMAAATRAAAVSEAQYSA
jgi:hypothetical protein